MLASVALCQCGWRRGRGVVRRRQPEVEREHRRLEAEGDEKKAGQLFCDNSSKDIVAMLLQECDEAGVDAMCTRLQTPSSLFGFAYDGYPIFGPADEDGTVPDDNPWQDRGEIARQFWTVGHRNMLGIAFDADGRLWVHEMGPRHGDELNIILAGQNYGWPLVSNGDHYSGKPIPDHDTRPEFEAPRTFWVPSIAPSGLVIYDGDMFADWKGSAIIGGLVSRALIRVDLKGDTAKEAERFKWGERIREVEQGPEGALYVLEDGSGGRLLKLTPSR